MLQLFPVLWGSLLYFPFYDSQRRYQLLLAKAARPKKTSRTAAKMAVKKKDLHKWWFFLLYQSQIPVLCRWLVNCDMCWYLQLLLLQQDVRWASDCKLIIITAEARPLWCWSRISVFKNSHCGGEEEFEWILHPMDLKYYLWPPLDKYQWVVFSNLPMRKLSSLHRKWLLLSVLVFFQQRHVTAHSNTVLQTHWITHSASVGHWRNLCLCGRSLYILDNTHTQICGHHTKDEFHLFTYCIVNIYCLWTCLWLKQNIHRYVE